MQIFNFAILGAILFPLTSWSVTTNRKLSKCIESVTQIECTIPVEIAWSCVKPNVIEIKAWNGSKQGHSEDSVVPSSYLLVNCTAPFPIDVRVSGSQVYDSTRSVFIRNAENVFNEATFVYTVGVLDSSHDFSSVRTISVFQLNDDTPATVTFSVFKLREQMNITEGQELKVGTSTEQHELEQGVGITTLIPCISPTLNSSPELVRVGSNNTSAVVTDAEYDVTKGFIIQNKNIFHSNSSNGEMFQCFVGGSSKNVNLSTQANHEITKFKIVPRKDLYIYPEFQRVVLFQRDELKLICRSKSKVQLNGTFKGEIIKATTTLEFDEFTATLAHSIFQIGDNGSVACVDEESGKSLFSWTIEVLDIENNDVLRVNKMDDYLVKCVSPKPTQLKMIFCQGETNCEERKWCFEPSFAANPTCTQSRIGNPCKDGGGTCIEMRRSGDNDPIYSQGMLQCRAGNYSYTTKFFRGFDGILYLDWTTAPASGLIEVFVPPDDMIMYPHNSYPFGCRAAPFISDGRIQWIIRGKDGSEILLHKDRVEDLRHSYYGLNSSLYTIRESNIRLIYPNDYDVLCMVPLWNSTAGLRHHKRINVAAHIPPVKEIVITSACIIILLVIPLIAVAVRLKKAREAIRNLTEQEVEEFIKGDLTTLNSKDTDPHEQIVASPYNQDYEIPRNKLLIDRENKLGEGEFGLVVKGKVEGIPEVVAVKTIKPRCEVNQFKGFMSELKIMIYIGKHPFVVGLIGAHTDKIKEKIMYIVVEYCANGSLDKFLLKKKNRYVNQVEENDKINPNITQPVENFQSHYVSICFAGDDEFGSETSNNNNLLKTVDLLRWACEIASAMAHLSRKRVVHADLAARNILINAHGISKITDFGLSFGYRMNYAQYVKKHEEPLLVPWRWMSEECLRSLTFSTHSDVWAYGIVLWELFSLGDVPYSGQSWDIAFVDELANGLRMSKPAYSPTFVYRTMQECWQHRPESRPSFEQLEAQFRTILTPLGINVQIHEDNET
ncbi:uncharacterized protein LOC118434171 isoform X2 [Folsomia candida]|uniref:uncharacterized protein LOC118434171 isoform X2 n=1 Tax=Folsomia candida TaxID=158441 RepID=UPI00160551ED|nr:uncharacterized protein LOC118434171 isoform X2 [Folsomia candida]